jgi:hypothetical protein
MNRSLRQEVLGLAAGLVLVMPVASGAVTETGGTPGDWLARYSGARTVGLGSAYVAAADAPIGVVWNPATLGFLDQNEILLETARLFEDTELHGLSFAVPGRWLPSLGFTVLMLRSGGFERTNELNESLGTFDNGETAFLFSASKHIGTRFSLGGNVKVVRQSLEEFNAGGFGVDLGGLVNVTPRLRLGFALLNIGGPSLKLRETDETYPVEMRGGLALRLLGGRGLIAAEIDRRGESPVRLHTGAEYWIQRSLGLRVGYDDSYAAGGMSYRLTPQVQFDYGVSDNALGLAHRVGVSYRFGGFYAGAHALPVVFSPTGDQPVTRISMQAHTKSDPDRWSLQFLNKSDEVVRQFGGKGVPPSHVEWDGKDENGLPLPDGMYRYTLVVYDREGRLLSDATRMVEISTGGPQGSVPVEVK